MNIPILMYHGVSPRSTHRFRRFVVEPGRFERQMEYLADAGFSVRTVSEIVDSRSHRSRLSSNVVGLTFDDAFRELLDHAFPVLERLGFRATVYVPTAYVGRTSTWLEEVGEGSRPLLSADEMRAMPAAVVEFGAHSHTHRALDLMPSAAARAEIDESKRVLQEAVAREVTSFAFPFGSECALTRRLVQEAGFTSACRVGYRHSSAGEDVFGLSRIPVYGGTDVESFARLLRSDADLRLRRTAAAAWQPVRRRLRQLTHGVAS